MLASLEYGRPSSLGHAGGRGLVMSHQKPGGPGERWHAFDGLVFDRLSLSIIGECVSFGGEVSTSSSTAG